MAQAATVAVLQALREARRRVIQSRRTMIRWRLRVMMAERCMTNQELAKKTKLNPVTISKLKNSKGMPRLHESTLNGLCNALHCTPADLIHFTPDSEVQLG